MAKKGKKDAFYGVRSGRRPGVYKSWEEASQQVNGYAGAVHQKFSTVEEARAFVDGAEYTDSSRSSSAERANSNASTSSTGAGGKKRHSDQVSDPRPTKKASLRGPGPTVPDYKRPALSSKERSLAGQGTLLVYCDGACSKNGSIHAKSGSGVHWVNPRNIPDISERTPGKQTNQTAELYAMVRVFQTDPDPSAPLCIFSDSRYSIDCMTKWMSGWARRDWRTVGGEPVSNCELIRLLHAYQQRRPGPISYHWVAAHAGNAGNERADQLAVIGARQPDVTSPDWKRELVELRRLPVHSTSSTASGSSKLQEYPAPAKPSKSASKPVQEEVELDWLLDSDEEKALAESQDFD